MNTQALDVRPVLAAGGHPLDSVLEAWGHLAPGQHLCVIAPFEPAPMMAMFSAQGVPVAGRQVGDEEYQLMLGPK